jgi:hypothetical protein
MPTCCAVRTTKWFNAVLLLLVTSSLALCFLFSLATLNLTLLRIGCADSYGSASTHTVQLA